MITVANKKDINMLDVWRNEIKTGIAEIDEQHKEIIHRLGILLDICLCCKGEDEVVEKISFFEEYMINHFNTEEKYMVQHNYEEYFAHRSIHEIFRVSFENMKKQRPKDGLYAGAVYNICKILTNWLISHMNNEDRALASFLQSGVGQKQAEI